jgi:hypothetical protein
MARTPVGSTIAFVLLCLAGIGDEMHMITECVEYTAVRQRHSQLFDCLGGWQHVVDGYVPAYALKQLMSREQHLVAAFLVDCSHAGGPAPLLSLWMGWATVHRMRMKLRPLWQLRWVMQRIQRLYWRIDESQ